jgi:hypothetical protein
MTLRKPGLQDPLSSPPSPESEGPGTHTLPGGAAWPDGAEINILEAIKLLRSEIVEMKTEVVATIEARIQEVSDTLKADLTILRNETVPAITLLKTTAASHTTTIAALETSTTNVSDLTTSLSFQGQSFSIYQDYSPTVSRQRAAFGQANPSMDCNSRPFMAIS